MKRFLTLVILMAVSSNLYCQKAPGKDETIVWLKEKLEKCLDGTYGSAVQIDGGPWKPGDMVSNVKLESIDECRFIITYVFNGKNYRAILPTDIQGIKNIYENVDGLSTISCVTFNYSAKVIEYTNVTDKKTSYSSGLWGISLAEREDDIYARIEKAMKHLATFCPKKKETF